MNSRDPYSGRAGGAVSFDTDNDFNEVQLKINKKQDESLESTRRMLTLCEETQDVGVKTIVMLNQQGEQLERVEEGMDKINADMKDAEKSLEGLEKCCGLCVLPWRKSKKFEAADDATWKAPEDGQTNTEGPKTVVAARGGAASAPTGPIITRITNDAREDEMEENMQQVSSMMGNLRNMAVDMGNEIDTQNRGLDRINYKAEKLDTRVQNANTRAQKIIRNQ